MNFPTKAERAKCWEARDQYWQCLNDNDPKHNCTSGEEVPKACLEMRQLFEISCPKQWVKHFDRKRTYEQFKAQMMKGYDPLVENTKKVS